MSWSISSARVLTGWRFTRGAPSCCTAKSTRSGCDHVTRYVTLHDTLRYTIRYVTRYVTLHDTLRYTIRYVTQSVTLHVTQYVTLHVTRRNKLRYTTHVAIRKGVRAHEPAEVPRHTRMARGERAVHLVSCPASCTGWPVYSS